MLSVDDRISQKSVSSGGMHPWWPITAHQIPKRIQMLTTPLTSMTPSLLIKTKEQNTMLHRKHIIRIATRVAVSKVLIRLRNHVLDPPSETLIYTYTLETCVCMPEDD